MRNLFNRLKEETRKSLVTASYSNLEAQDAIIDLKNNFFPAQLKLQTCSKVVLHSRQSISKDFVIKLSCQFSDF